jgi:phosphoglycolate phosphatase-like HAD superfamily hydrolase
VTPHDTAGHAPAVLFDIDGTLVDSNYLQACGRVGVSTIAVLSGGVSRGELKTAGAKTVFENTLDLYEHLETSPIAALAHVLPTG